jgi:DNA-binding SARP family transcriptional activator/TolB-like protein
MIELRTLGTLELTSADSNAVSSVLAQPRRSALLCYLALAFPRGFHRRDTLFALFWPEVDADQARHALRQSLYFLRRQLGLQAIVSRGDDELALAPEQVHCDVWDFDAAIDQGRPADALAQYRGELLAGFHISGAAEFERWLDDERARVRQRAVEAGWALAAAREREGETTGAVDAARRAASLAPTDETALRRLMLLLERLGDRAGALRAYQDFAWKLREEYELEPSAETQAVVARIRAEARPSPFAAPGHSNGPSPAAGNGDSTAGTPLAGTLRPPRPGATDLLPEVEFRSPALVTEPTPDSPPSRVRGPAAIVGGAVLLLLLLWPAGLYLRTQARDRTLSAPAPPAGEAAPAVAVLPFAVQEGALANWREGLVDLLSMNLRGVTGLRAVESRTLLARWREQVGDEETPELATALDVADRAGARYAVVGSLMVNGPFVVLSSGVHEVAGRRMLGTARSQGPVDSIFSLVDRLTVEILRLVLRGEARELSRINLAQLSTSSLPALKSYLEGEALFRRSQFQRAAEAYATAVEADSSFALARYRLGLSRWWFWTSMSGPLPDPLFTEVSPIADRLPQHEAAILRSILVSQQDVQAARELLEVEVRRHPDDAETWHELGELYYHSGPQALAPPEAADRAFARAIQLDSTFTLPYIHRIDHAIRAADTTGAAQLFSTFARLAPESPFVTFYGLVIGLAFGDPTTRFTAEAALDTLKIHDLFSLGLMLRGQRCCWGVAEQVLRKVRARGELQSDATNALFRVSLAQGKAGEALEWVDDPFMPAEAKGRMLQVLDELGVPIPAARLDAAFTLGPEDSAEVFQLFYAGSYAASRARWQLLRGVLGRLQARAEHLRKTGDSSQAGFSEAVRQALEGYAWWRRGQRDSALLLLERSQRRAVGGTWERELLNGHLRWWLGRLLLEMGRPREALPYFESFTSAWLPTELPTDYERGRIYERLGQVERAREAYALFLAPRQQADPMFQPMIQDARAALQRLAVAATE